jgi:hypothetical protein
MTSEKRPLLDEDEAALARILHALPGGEPPAALDARVLKAAQDAVAATPEPRRRGSRWILSSLGWLGTAAAAMLTVSVTVRLIDDPEMRMPPLRQVAPATEAADAAAEPEQAPIPVDLEAAVRAEAASEEAQERAMGGRADAAASMDSIPPPPPPATRTPARQPAPAAPEPFPQEDIAANASAAATGYAGEPAADSSEVEGVAVLGSRVRRAAEAEAAPPAQTDDRDQAAAPQLGAAASAEAQATSGFELRGPAEWLNEIRRLLDAGQREQARRSLADFRRAYPNYTVPSDIDRRIEP